MRFVCCGKELIEEEFSINPKTGEYYKNCNSCRECHKEYYEQNKDIIKEKKKEYREQNKDIINEKKKEYYEQNKDKIKEKMKEYDKSNALYETYKDKLIGVDYKSDEEGYLLVRCKYCNKWFHPNNSNIKHYIQAGNGTKNLYCSDGCKKSCPTYRMVKYEKGFRQNTSREVQPELRKLVLERDNWTCQKCGRSKDEDINLILHCHHIDPVKNNPIESADMDNCITLCKECHKETHRRKGCRYSDLANCSTH